MQMHEIIILVNVIILIIKIIFFINASLNLDFYHVLNNLIIFYLFFYILSFFFMVDPALEIDVDKVNQEFIEQSEVSKKNLLTCSLI